MGGRLRRSLVARTELDLVPVGPTRSSVFSDASAEILRSAAQPATARHDAVRLQIRVSERREPDVFIIEIRDDGTPEIRAEGAALLTAGRSTAVEINSGRDSILIEVDRP